MNGQQLTSAGRQRPFHGFTSGEPMDCGYLPNQGPGPGGLGTTAPRCLMASYMCSSQAAPGGMSHVSMARQPRAGDDSKAGRQIAHGNASGRRC